jgi:hypothetical protein
MRRSSTAILAAVLVATAAQQPSGGTSRGSLRSGPPTLTSPNPFTNPQWRFPPRFGTRPIGPWTSMPGWRRSELFPNPLILNWNGVPPFNGDGFYNMTDPSYFTPDMTDYYPQPAQPLQVPPAAADPVDGGEVPEVAESSLPDTSAMPVYRGPASPPPVSDEHPPLIALKNRWAYTVLKYWVKGKTFHFITTQGDHVQVPAALVERIYPTPDQTRLEPKKPSAN